MTWALTVSQDTAATATPMVRKTYLKKDKGKEKGTKCRLG
jgi:hypothetical protein